MGARWEAVVGHSTLWRTRAGDAELGRQGGSMPQRHVAVLTSFEGANTV